ncbi:MAG: DEAD/DEAH box helicase [Flavobacteriales bacterium]|jgi:ATP-dependent RNA helicase DeaD|nr:DEAD/DEAH box helicase [Flavobacteriales bacterium]
MDNPFLALGLDERLVAAVGDLGYEKPSEVQQKAIPHLLQDQSDLVSLAQTGTGKTAAFSLPLLQHINTSKKHIQGVILSPTRELALQIAEDIKSFSKYLPKIKVATVYGGASIENQYRDIKRNPQIVVATPGRLKDMLKRRMIKLEEIKVCILDEADEMLNMGFKDDLDFILDRCGEERNTWLFSATMPPEVSRIAKEYMSNPFEITCGRKNEGSNNVAHQYVVVQNFNRYQALKRLIDFQQDMFGVIFCRTRHETQDVAAKLINDGYNAGPLHGDLSQAQRDTVMGHFRKRNIQFLVATDVAARGIDVNDITHVIHYKLPEQIESYTHRSGRTGRAGKSGISISITTSSERKKIKAIERVIKKEFDKVLLPSSKDVANNKLMQVVNKLKNQEINEELISKYTSYLSEEFDAVSKEELLQKFVTMEMEIFLKGVSDDDINHKGQRNDERGSGKGDRKRFYISIGEKDGFKSWTELKDVLRETTGLGKDDFTHVDVMKTFSFFTVASRNEKLVFDKFNGSTWKGRNVSVELTKEKKSRPGRRKSPERRRRRRN